MIPFVDLTREYQQINAEIDDSMHQVINKGDFILGKEVNLFEEKFAEYCETKYSVGVASGTEAILLSLRALHIGENDEVIVPANTFIASVLPILELGATLIFVDIDPITSTLSVEDVLKKITKKTKAIIAVHLYGYPANMDPLVEIAKRSRIFLIEDACQAHGSLYKNKKLGGFGDIGCFSFYPAKNLGAYGDGGAIVTNSSELAEEIKILRNIGQKNKYYHIRRGYNSRLDTIQAAILLVKLQYLDRWNEMRRIIASSYNNMLNDLPISLPFSSDVTVSNYHLYVVRTQKRDELKRFLSANSINTGIHYPIPLHLQECLRGLGYEKGDFPITEKYADEVLSLPMFPFLKDSEIQGVAHAMKEFYEDKK